MMKNKKSNIAKISILLCLALSISILFPFAISAEESIISEDYSDDASTCTVSYGKGIYISYAGAEPRDFIKGEPPESQTVNLGESVTVAANTFTFRDYSFGGWKYTYTDSNGEKITLYYNEGDVIETLQNDIKLEATWTKKQDNLKIDAFATYADTNEKQKHYIGEITILKDAPPSPAENYEFCGWTDNDGVVLYSPLDEYEIKKINTVIKPVWAKDGEKINYKKVSVSTSKGGTASLSEIYLLSGTTQKIRFIPDEGYILNSVTINGVYLGNNDEITFTVESEDMYIEAIFAELPKGNESGEEESSVTEDFTVTVNVEGGGYVSPSNKLYVKKGDSVSFTLIPDKNYRLPLEISDNGESKFFNKQWNGEYTLTDIREDHVINVSFVSETSVLNPSIGTESKIPQTNETPSKFTAKICIVILIFSAVFGFIAVKFRNPKTKKKNKK